MFSKPMFDSGQANLLNTQAKPHSLLANFTTLPFEKKKPELFEPKTVNC